MSQKKYPNLIILGIDGATWDIILPAVERGLLPNFAQFIQKGVWGPLESTIPPVTAPAWTSFMTGKNPAKHAIFDFAEHPVGSYQIRYICGGQRKSKTIWQLLSESGHRVGTMNVPMTYPPDEINGFMISGLDAPDNNADFIYPRELKREIESRFGKLVLDIHQLAHMRDDATRDEVLEQLIRQEQKRAEIAFYLLEEKAVDIFMLLFNATDQVQHHFWHYMDKKHLLHDPQGYGKYGSAILKVYQCVDDLVGKFLLKFPGSSFILMSDHGFRATSDIRLRLNLLLKEAGFLTLKKGKTLSKLSRKMGSEVYNQLRGLLPASAKAKIAALMPGVREGLESFVFLSAIDWSKTQAFAWEFCPTSPNIFLNTRERFPRGIVSLGEREKVLDKLTELLVDLRDKRGQQIIPEVYRREDVYHGEYLELAPDLVLNWWDDPSFLVESSFGGHAGSGEIISYADRVEPGFEWGGIHAIDGIFGLYGKEIREGKECRLNILDMALIILHIMKEKTPTDFDGKIPENIFREKSFQEDWEFTEDTTQLKETTEVAYSQEEEEKIKDRLKDLGYLS